MSKWKSQILNRLRNKIDNLTNNNQNYKINVFTCSSCSKDQDVLAYLKKFPEEICYCYCRYKASDNFGFIFKRFYVSRILQVITGNNTHTKSLRTFNEIRDEVLNLSKSFGIEVKEESKQSPSMYLSMFPNYRG